MTATGARILAALSPRERDTLVGICSGKSNAEIASLLGTTEQVIKNRILGIRRKLGSRSRAAMIVFCFYHGIVECPCGGRKKSE